MKHLSLSTVFLLVLIVTPALAADSNVIDLDSLSQQVGGVDLGNFEAIYEETCDLYSKTEKRHTGTAAKVQLVNKATTAKVMVGSIPPVSFAWEGVFFY